MVNIELLKSELAGIDIRFDEPLKRYTYTKVGGPADYLAFPRNRYELVRLVKFANREQIPWMVLGNASNIIVRDGGIRGFVIMFDQLHTIMVNGYTIEAEAGAKLIDTTHVALHHSLTGFEFACGIPGSVGGAIYMNAGAYGGEVSEVVEYVEVITPEGHLKTYSAEELEFSYRHSFIQNTGDLVIEVGFQLDKGNQEEIDEKIAELTHLRQSKQPLEYPSCGSVFKRPEGYFTGKLIQDAGLQGYQIGGAQVSKKHAGFIVNIDNATATDYMDLIRHIQKVILEKDGVSLEPEVRIIGEEPTSH